MHNSSTTLAVQVLSYRPHTEATLQFGKVRLFTARNGKCIVCGCSTFRHSVGPLHLTGCKHPCPATTIKAHNSDDLVSLSLPQICDPSIKSPGQLKGSIELEFRADTVGVEFRLEAPVVTLPRFEGPVTKATRRLLYEMQDRRCNGCFTRQELDYLTYDHRVPKSRGGLREIGNAELMCAPCNNQEKRSRDMYTFLWARHRRALMHLIPNLTSSSIANNCTTHEGG